MTKVIKTTPDKAYKKLSKDMNNNQKEEFKEILKGSKDVQIHLNFQGNESTKKLINKNIINQIIFLNYNGTQYGLKQIDKTGYEISEPIFRYNKTYNCFAILFDKYCFLYHDSNRNYRRFGFDYSYYEYMLNKKDDKFEQNYKKQFGILGLQKFFLDNFVKFATNEIYSKFRDKIRGARENRFQEEEEKFYEYFIDEIEQQGFLNIKIKEKQKTNKQDGEGIIYLDKNGITLKANNKAKPGLTYTLNGKNYYVAKNKNDIMQKIFVEKFSSENIITTFITDMSEIFASKRFNKNISTWDTSNVTNMSGIFYSTKSFNQDISNWDTSNVTDMSQMFYNAREFNQPIGGWDTSNVTDMSQMFYNAREFNQPIGGWNTSKVKNMYSMFEGAKSFNQSLNNWDTSKVENMTQMFKGAEKFNQPIGNWDVSNVTNMNSMFLYCYEFNQSLNNWNTSNVTDMNHMFRLANSFNQPIGNWNVSSVINMRSMFGQNKVFNQPIGNWNTSNVKDMSWMFYGSKFNQNIGEWNVSAVTDMNSMFGQNKVFNQPIGNWNTSNVTDMSQMFNDAYSFNQPLNNWNTSKVTNMFYMFKDAKAFNQPLNNWDTSKVTDMRYMFDGAKSFNQNISNWNIKKTIKDNNFYSFSVDANPKWKKEFKPKFPDK